MWWLVPKINRSSGSKDVRDEVETFDYIISLHPSLSTPSAARLASFESTSRAFIPEVIFHRTNALALDDLIRFVVIMLFEFPLNCSAAPSAPTGNEIIISMNRTPPPRWAPLNTRISLGHVCSASKLSNFSIPFDDPSDKWLCKLLAVAARSSFVQRNDFLNAI